MNTVKLITEANDFSTSNYIIEEKDNGKKFLRKGATIIVNIDGPLNKPIIRGF